MITDKKYLIYYLYMYIVTDVAILVNTLGLENAKLEFDIVIISGANEVKKSPRT